MFGQDLDRYGSSGELVASAEHRAHAAAVSERLDLKTLANQLPYRDSIHNQQNPEKQTGSYDAKAPTASVPRRSPAGPSNSTVAPPY